MLQRTWRELDQEELHDLVEAMAKILDPEDFGLNLVNALTSLNMEIDRTRFTLKASKHQTADLAARDAEVKIITLKQKLKKAKSDLRDLKRNHEAYQQAVKDVMGPTFDLLLADRIKSEEQP